MRHLTVLLTLVTSLVYGQSQVECLDSPDKLVLFNRQIKYATLQSISPTDEFLPDTVYLKINFAAQVKYDYLIKGIQLLIVNTSQRDLTFSDDVILELFCQARRPNGEWIDIEGRKMPWNCNGKTLTLKKMSYYKAIVPCYQGIIQTEMRYRFVVGDRIFYSEEFVGNVNEGQIKE